MRTVKADIEAKDKTEQEDLIAPIADFVIKALTLGPTSSVGWATAFWQLNIYTDFVGLAIANPTYTLSPKPRIILFMLLFVLSDLSFMLQR